MNQFLHKSVSWTEHFCFTLKRKITWSTSAFFCLFYLGAVYFFFSFFLFVSFFFLSLFFDDFFRELSNPRIIILYVDQTLFLRTARLLNAEYVWLSSTIENFAKGLRIIHNITAICSLNTPELLSTQATEYTSIVFMYFVKAIF